MKQGWSTKHQEMLKAEALRLAECEQWSVRAIARELNVSKSEVGRWLKELKALEQDLPQDFKSEMAEMAKRVLRKYIKRLQDKELLDTSKINHIAQTINILEEKRKSWENEPTSRHEHIHKHRYEEMSDADLEKRISDLSKPEKKGPKPEELN